MRIFNRRNNNGTNITEPAALIQSGWGAITASASAQETASVTFPVAYQNVPIIVVQFGGDQVSGSAVLGNGGNSVQSSATAKHYNDSTTGFNVMVWSGATPWSAGNLVYYTWIAIGV